MAMAGSDLFVGGRLTPRNYPSPTRSYILRNDGGRFTDVTSRSLPELVQPGGMITDAVWIDFDGDGSVDLVTAGEWMPIQFYRNNGKRFVNVTGTTGLPPLRGWWYSLATGDFDNDGRPDLVAGNLGLNYTYTTSKDGRFGVYAADFTGTARRTSSSRRRSTGPSTHTPASRRWARRSTRSVRGIHTYGSFATASVREAFGQALQNALHYQTDTFASVVLPQRRRREIFRVATPEPRADRADQGESSPTDVDGDGHLDLIVAGNIYDAEPNTPRADAGNGLWLRETERVSFDPVRAE